MIIGPHHYDYSIGAIIEGLNRKDGVKVFSNSEHNHCIEYSPQLETQVQLCRLADVVVLGHSALEPKYIGGATRPGLVFRAGNKRIASLPGGFGLVGVLRFGLCRLPTND